MTSPRTQRYRVLVVGCGLIAGGGPMVLDARHNLTHAAAFGRHPDFVLGGCVDPTAANRASFQARWAVPAGYATLPQALADGPWDVVCICSPDAAHGPQLLEALGERPPRLIFAEKPLATTLATAEAVVAAAEARGVAVWVNYVRRWDPACRRIAAALQARRWGRVTAVHGLYGRGLLHTGSHLLDLLDMLLGPLDHRATGRRFVDYAEDDPTCDALLSACDGTVSIMLQGTPQTACETFELTVQTEMAQIRFEQGGQRVRLRKPVADTLFAFNAVLGAGRALRSTYADAFDAAVANVAAHLSRGEPGRSTARTALRTMVLCDRIAATSGPIDPGHRARPLHAG